ncbi:MAG: flagella basal body P-ring formation protein FlgA [Planctomyces sp.]|nr:flagella basal body P-ring formation protein FlgA [Planctomyces sp.]
MAAQLAGVVLWPRPDDAGRPTPDASAGITAGDVRSALQRHAPGLHWGKLTISGGRVRVLLPQRSAPRPLGQPPQQHPDEPWFSAAESDPPSRLRSVLERLRDAHGVPLADVRLRVRGPRPDTAAWLAAAPAPGMRTAVTVGGSLRSGRAPVTIEEYAGERLAAVERLGVDVQLRSRAATLVRPVRRGAPIGPDDASDQTRWLSPEIEPLDTAQAVGMIAQEALAVGDAVSRRSVERPHVVRRGEEVVLNCLSGGMLIKGRAKAMADAAAGELVEVRLDGTRRLVMARADDRGVVTIVLRQAEPAGIARVTAQPPAPAPTPAAAPEPGDAAGGVSVRQGNVIIQGQTVAQRARRPSVPARRSKP